MRDVRTLTEIHHTMPTIHAVLPLESFACAGLMIELLNEDCLQDESDPHPFTITFYVNGVVWDDAPYQNEQAAREAFARMVGKIESGELDWVREPDACGDVF